MGGKNPDKTRGTNRPLRRDFFFPRGNQGIGFICESFHLFAPLLFHTFGLVGWVGLGIFLWEKETSTASCPRRTGRGAHSKPSLCTNNASKLGESKKKRENLIFSIFAQDVCFPFLTLSQESAVGSKGGSSFGRFIYFMGGKSEPQPS